MIMPSQESNLNTNLSTNNFSIEMNGTMFSMLSKNVYNDVILAPIREWSTNAVDACIAADKEVKFDVHLPVADNLTFSVRDYGTGLTDEEINTLFATFGASTKRNSNKFNGTFGIGRMSALAYAKQFTVESFIDGKHIVYLITTNNNIPQMVYMGVSDTTEPNGLKLSLPVQVSDVQKFISKASDLYGFFEHKPKTNVKIETEKKYLLKGTNWKVLKGWSTTSYAIMGNVPYEISERHTNIPSGLIFNLPLGSVSITPGRESLNYDDTTVKTLKKYYEELLEEVNLISIKTINAAGEDYYKLHEFNEAFCALPYSVKSSSSLAELIQKVAAKKYYNFSRTEFECQFARHIPNLSVKIKDKYNNTLRKVPYVVPNTNQIFLIADTRTGIVSAARQYSNKFKTENSSNNHVIILSMEQFRKTDVENFVKNCKDFFSKVGITEYDLSSNYVSDKKGKTENSGLFKPYTIHLSSKIDGMNTVVKQNSQLAKDYTVKTPYVLSSGSTLLLKNLEKFVTYYEYLSILKENVSVSFPIAVPKKYVKEAEENPLFVDFFEYVEDLYKNNPVIFKDLSEKDTMAYRSLSPLEKYSFGPEIKKLLPAEMTEYLETVHDFVEKYRYKPSALADPSRFKKYFDTTIEKPDIKITGKELQNKYSLLLKIVLKPNNITAEDIEEYIKLLEA